MLIEIRSKVVLKSFKTIVESTCDLFGFAVVQKTPTKYFVNGLQYF